MQNQLYKNPEHVELHSRYNNETVSGRLLGKTQVDGKDYYVLENHGRVIKVSADSFYRIKGTK